MVKRENAMENEETRSSGSMSTGEQERIRQLEQQQEQMRLQMQQMVQLLQANSTKAPESSYPCPNFGNVDFKREKDIADVSNHNKSNKSNNNNNLREANKNLDKEKLWSMYLAGKVSLDGKEAVKFESGTTSSDDEVVEVELEEEEEEEEAAGKKKTPGKGAPKPASENEGFNLDDWDLVYDEGKVVAILCEPCRFVAVFRMNVVGVGHWQCCQSVCLFIAVEMCLDVMTRNGYLGNYVFSSHCRGSSPILSPLFPL